MGAASAVTQKFPNRMPAYNKLESRKFGRTIKFNISQFRTRLSHPGQSSIPPEANSLSTPPYTASSLLPSLTGMFPLSHPVQSGSNPALPDLSHTLHGQPAISAAGN